MTLELHRLVLEATKRFPQHFLERQTGIAQSWWSTWANKPLQDSYGKYPTDSGHLASVLSILGEEIKDVKPSEKLPRILHIDIESAPTLGFVFGRFKQFLSPSHVVRRGYVLCWCAKWHNEPTMITCSQADFGKEGTEDDEEVVRAAYDMFEMADIIVAHNADRYDIPMLRRQWMKYGMPPPQPYRSADTLKMAKSSAKFEANSLAELGAFFELGSKMQTGGFDLWARCMKGEKEAFQEMVDYCCGDVELLEAVYMKLLPYAKTHPNVALYGINIKPRCTRCGSSDLRPLEKSSYTMTRQYTAFRCGSCSSINRSRTHSKTAEEMQNILNAA